MTQKKESEKMPYREFVENAVRTLRKPKYKGIHVVWSKFNESFELYYGVKPRPILDQLVKERFIVLHPAKGGVIMYLASEYEGEVVTGPDALGKILEGKARSKK